MCTEADLNYVGSLTIDQDWIDASGMHEGQKVAVLNVNNGHRIETYLFNGTRGSGKVCANGPAAHLVSKGDILLVLSFVSMSFEESKIFKPRILLFDDSTEDSYISQEGSYVYKENMLPKFRFLGETQSQEELSKLSN